MRRCIQTTPPTGALLFRYVPLHGMGQGTPQTGREGRQLEGETMRGTDGGNGHKPLHWRSEKLAKDRQQQCKRAQEALKNYSSPKLEVMILADLEIDEEYQRA